MPEYGDLNGNCTFSDCENYRGGAKRNVAGEPLTIFCNYKEKKIGFVDVTKEHHCPLRNKK